MTGSKVVHIEVEIHALPEWYMESEHDHCLEDAIERSWQKAYPDATVQVFYGCAILDEKTATVVARSDDGDIVFEREHDVGYAFDAAEMNC